MELDHISCAEQQIPLEEFGIELRNSTPKHQRSKKLLDNDSEIHSDAQFTDKTQQICEMNFKSNHKLKRHKVSHSASKLFSCKICPKMFAQSSALKSHNRTHNGEKPYECSWCNKKFAQSGALKLHIRIHTGEKPCVCKVCDKRFSQPGSLQVCCILSLFKLLMNWLFIR